MSSEFFKVLADETRLRCLTLIFEQQEMCVCELSYALDLPQSKISRHLSIMKLNQLIIDRRQEQWVLYSPHPQVSPFQKEIIHKVIKEYINQQPFQMDRERLQSMPSRPTLALRKEAADV